MSYFTNIIGTKCPSCGVAATKQDLILCCNMAITCRTCNKVLCANCVCSCPCGSCEETYCVDHKYRCPECGEDGYCDG